MDKHRREDNVAYLFGATPERQTRKPRAARTAAMPKPALEPPAHTLDSYLTFLQEREFITAKELAVLTAALEPLRARFNGLSTVEAVRNELRAKSATVDALRRDEQARWQNQDILPWFDLEKALDSFMADPNKVALHICFLNEEARAAMKPYIDPELTNGEVFFWVILRMYRLHATACPEDSIDPENDRQMAELVNTDNVSRKSIFGRLADRLLNPWRKT